MQSFKLAGLAREKVLSKFWARAGYVHHPSDVVLQRHVFVPIDGSIPARAG